MLVSVHLVGDPTAHPTTYRVVVESSAGWRWEGSLEEYNLHVFLAQRAWLN